jgi:hypothetical protein
MNSRISQCIWCPCCRADCCHRLTVNDHVLEFFNRGINNIDEFVAFKNSRLEFEIYLDANNSPKTPSKCRNIRLGLTQSQFIFIGTLSQESKRSDLVQLNRGVSERFGLDCVSTDNLTT